MKTFTTFAIAALFTSNIAIADDTTAVKTVIDKYEAALNASNTDSVMKLYGKTPIFMPQHAPAQVGRAAVKQAYDNVFNTIKLNVKFTTHEVEVSGDTAWARTSTTGKTKILAKNVLVNEGNNELFIFKKENGAWKIHRYLFSTNLPRK